MITNSTTSAATPSRIFFTMSLPPGALRRFLLRAEARLTHRLLHIGWKVRHLRDLADLDHFTVGCGAAQGPIDGLLLRLHLDHPIPTEHFLRFGERPVGHR